jgi:hypothetical protein
MGCLATNNFKVMAIATGNQRRSSQIPWGLWGRSTTSQSPRWYLCGSHLYYTLSRIYPGNWTHLSGRQFNGDHLTRKPSPSSPTLRTITSLGKTRTELLFFAFTPTSSYNTTPTISFNEYKNFSINGNVKTSLPRLSWERQSIYLTKTR